MDRDQAIAVAREFLASSGCHVDSLGHVMLHSIADQDPNADSIWDHYLQSAPNRTPELDAQRRAEIESLKLSNREYWSVAFHINDPPGVATSPGGPIVNVYPNGSADFFDVL